MLLEGCWTGLSLIRIIWNQGSGSFIEVLIIQPRLGTARWPRWSV